MKKIDIKVEKINPDAVIPSFKKQGDAGMDLVSVESGDIPPMSVKVFGTGLKFEIPEGYEIQVRPRSGLASRHGISVLNTPGTVDSGYRGEVKVILFNFSNETFVVEKGMRIAQMVVNELPDVNLFEVKNIDTNSDRSDGGFGSTGLNWNVKI